MRGLKLEWEKMGWINIAETVSSFPWPGLPADVHFYFSYSPNSEMVKIFFTRYWQQVWMPFDMAKYQFA